MNRRGRRERRGQKERRREGERERGREGEGRTRTNTEERRGRRFTEESGENGAVENAGLDGETWEGEEMENVLWHRMEV